MLFFLQLTCRGRHNDAVAAADGNSDKDASTMTPPNNRNILTVSAIESGTNMAAPHMAGTAALHKAMFPDTTPDKVMAEIVAISTQPDIPCDGGPRGYFAGETDGLKELLLFRSLLHP